MPAASSKGYQCSVVGGSVSLLEEGCGSAEEDDGACSAPGSARRLAQRMPTTHGSGVFIQKTSLTSPDQTVRKATDCDVVSIHPDDGVFGVVCDHGTGVQVSICPVPVQGVSPAAAALTGLPEPQVRTREPVVLVDSNPAPVLYVRKPWSLLLSPYVQASVVYVLYTWGMLAIDFALWPRAGEEESEGRGNNWALTRINAAYAILATVHVLNACQYLVSWLPAGAFDALCGCTGTGTGTGRGARARLCCWQRSGKSSRGQVELSTVAPVASVEHSTPLPAAREHIPFKHEEEDQGTLARPLSASSVTTTALTGRSCDSGLQVTTSPARPGARVYLPGVASTSEARYDSTKAARSYSDESDIISSFSSVFNNAPLMVCTPVRPCEDVAAGHGIGVETGEGAQEGEERGEVCGRLFDLQLTTGPLPDWLNIISALLYTSSACLYPLQDDVGEGLHPVPYSDPATVRVRRIEIVAATVELMAAMLWMTQWLYSRLDSWSALQHPGGSCSGPQPVWRVLCALVTDMDWWANAFTLAPALLYAVFAAQTLAHPPSLCCNKLYEVGDVLYALGAAAFFCSAVRAEWALHYHHTGSRAGQQQQVVRIAVRTAEDNS